MKKLILSCLWTLLLSENTKADMESTILINFMLGAIVNVMPDEMVGYMSSCALFSLYNGYTWNWSTPFLALPSYLVGAHVGRTTKYCLCFLKSCLADHEQPAEVYHYHYYEPFSPHAPAAPAAPMHQQSPAAPTHQPYPPAAH